MIEVNTIIEKVQPNNIDKAVMSRAGQIIRQGGLVAFPTETVYGLGADGMNESAAKKIYEAKGRPSDNPLILHICSIEQLDEIALEVPELAKKLMDRFWPGPMTLIFKKKPEVPYGTTGGLDTVAVRFPDHPVALELIRAAGTPVAAPSANTSGRPSPTKAEHVKEDMDGKIQMIIDAGLVGIGIESTIIDVTGKIPMILRPGFITREMVEEVVGEVLVDKVVLAKNIEDAGGKDYVPKAPGMKYRHYAPKAELTMFEGDTGAVVRHINELCRKVTEQGKIPGVIATEETKNLYKNAKVLSIGNRRDEATIARGLYDVLREFDHMDVDCIYGETFYGDGLGAAIMNRLIKAAGYKLEKVVS